MFRLTGHIFFCVTALVIHQAVHAQQKNAASKSAFAIFEDLPVDDPAANSVLHEQESAEEKIRKNIFAKTSLNKSRCYLGEPVLLTCRLYSSLQSTSTIPQPPPLPGFIVSDIAVSNETPQYSRTAGKNYRVFTVRKVQLIPVQQGILNIAPVVLNNKVQYEDENLTAHTYAGTVTGNALRLSVEPLPAKGKPAAFSGLIGRFQVNARVRSIELPAGENNVLYIEITGSGNFSDCPAPVVTWPDDLEHFAAKEQLQIKEDSFPSTGKKIFEIPFVARQQGAYTIPAIAVNYFDPASAVYRSTNSQAVNLKILPALIKPPPAPPTPVSIKKYPLYVLVIPAIMLAAFSIGFVYYVKRNKRRKPTITVQPVEDLQEPEPAIDFMKEVVALEYVQAEDEYLAAVKKLVLDFLAVHYNMPVIMEEEQVKALQAVNARLATAVQQLYHDCNLLLYSPGSLNDATKQTLQQQCRVIITNFGIQKVYDTERSTAIS